jgi:hypothetical protein
MSENEYFDEYGYRFEKPPISAEYMIPEHRLAKLEKKVKKLNRIAQKLGLPEISFERLAGALEWRDLAILQDNYDSEKVKVLCHPVRVSGVAPVLSGYSFVARIDHLAGGNLVLGGDSLTLDPAWKTCDPWCDHCQTVRSRKTSYIVREEETGETKQVGKSCLKDFLGHQNPVEVAEVASFLWEVEDGRLLDAEPELDAGLKAEELGHTPRMVLAVACAVIRAEGLFRPARTDPREGTPTVDLVKDFFASKHGRAAFEVGEADYAEADRIIEWARGLSESTDSYLNNICVLAQEPAVTFQRFGFLCSAPAAFARAMRKALEEAERPVGEHFGTPGEKAAAVLLYTGNTYFDTQYGTQYVHFFETEAADRIVWKSGNFPYGLNQGERYTAQFTVKEHGERNGKKQTVILRPKFYEMELALESGSPQPKKYKKMLQEYLAIAGSVDTLNRVTPRSPNPPLLDAARNGELALVELLLDAGVDPNVALDAKGRNHPLSVASTVEVVDALLDAGSDPALIAPEDYQYIEDEIKERLGLTKQPSPRAAGMRM